VVARDRCRAVPPGHDPLPQIAALPGPVLLYVGRVAVEKNLGAFLDCRARQQGGGGRRADLAMLKARYPQAHFTGALAGAALAQAYRAADCFVFPAGPTRSAW
jgi:glycosyltransferase involved in cell wall biosynthesis